MHSSRQRQGGREPLRAFVSAASSGALPACGEALGQRLQAGHGDMLQVLVGREQQYSLLVAHAFLLTHQHCENLLTDSNTGNPFHQKSHHLLAPSPRQLLCLELSSKETKLKAHISKWATRHSERTTAQ